MATPQKTAQGTWRVQIEVRGVRESNTLPTRREAIEWRDRRSSELRAVTDGQAGTVYTLKQAMRKYAEEVSPTKRGQRWEVIRLKAYEGAEHGLPINKPLAKFTDDEVQAWRDRRLLTNSRGTVIRDMTLMDSVLQAARLEWKWIKANPVRDVRKPTRPEHRKRLISGRETRRVLRALGYTRGPVRTVSHAVALAFLVALATGMRAGEVCGLRWADMREMYGTAHNVKAREAGVSRDVPLSPVARKLIERLRGWDDDLVFGVGAATLDALFRRARKKAGLEGFTFHDSRHTAATRLAGRLHILELCLMFGWKNTSQALTYYNMPAAQIARRL